MIDASKLAEEDASPAASGATSSATRLFRRYLLSLSTGVLGALGLFWLALFWLERTENLPPPAFSNNLCVDEKLDFLRSNPIASPNLLVIGRSEEHTSEFQSRENLVCRLLLEKKKVS